MTIEELVLLVHQRAVKLGMDVAPSDVAFIISTFLEGMSSADPKIPAVDNYLVAIADAVNSVKDRPLARGSLEDRS